MIDKIFANPIRFCAARHRFQVTRLMHLSAVPGVHAVPFDPVAPPQRSGFPGHSFTDMMDARAERGAALCFN